MKKSSRSRKLLLGALAFAGLAYGIHRHAAAAEARQQEAARTSGVWVDLYAFRIVPEWFATHPGGSCEQAVASLAGKPWRDGWGRPYQLTCEPGKRGERVLVRSAGPDGVLGTDDDVYSYALSPGAHNG